MIIYVLIIRYKWDAAWDNVPYNKWNVRSKWFWIMAIVSSNDIKTWRKWNVFIILRDLRLLCQLLKHNYCEFLTCWCWWWCKYVCMMMTMMMMIMMQNYIWLMIMIVMMIRTSEKTVLKNFSRSWFRLVRVRALLWRCLSFHLAAVHGALALPPTSAARLSRKWRRWFSLENWKTW